MQYRECPYCGAHLDPCERCDCQEKQEDAPDAAGTPSQKPIETGFSVTNPEPDVNPCFRLRAIREQTGVMAKDTALVVREVFPKFNRQLLAQCEAWDKYGVIIHPDGLRAICRAYGVPMTLGPTTAITPTAKPTEGLTQCDRILRHFQDYGSITSLEAMKEYGIMRLASRISDLRRLGYTIKKTTETSKNRYGEPTSYARYSLEDDSHGTDA